MVRSVPPSATRTRRSSEPSDLDGLFAALADPTRRAVVERLGEGPAATTDLARPFDMALPSFTQHLGVLEASGIVRSTKRGRVRIWRLDPEGLGPATGWLTVQRERWEQRLDQLDDYLASGAVTTEPNQPSDRSDRSDPDDPADPVPPTRKDPTP